MSLLFMLLLPVWNFETDLVGGLPRGWEARGGSAIDVYRIDSDSDGNRFLAAHSRGSGVQLGIALTAKPEKLSTLSWRWRIWELPSNADERTTRTMDSAAAVYAVFGSRLYPRILKYVWSASVPAGASFKHPASSRLVIFVVESGKTHAGQWQYVSRNLADDYRSAFRSDPGNLIGLGLKTDSDSTGTSARADYDDLRLESR